jgi:uroporphyrinogen decarboxylase
MGITDKERYTGGLKFRNVDRIPNVEAGVWPATKKRWVNEGMPENAIKGNDLFFGNEYFKLDACESIEVDTIRPYPKQKPRILEKNEKYLIYIDDFGRTRRSLKRNLKEYDGLPYYNLDSMDQFFDFPVKDRRTYLNHIKKFTGNPYVRYPENYNNIKLSYKKLDIPLYLLSYTSEHFGYYSMLRSWMGTVGLSYMLYDNPSLIHEACEFLTDFIIKTLTKAIKEIHFDILVIHEDLCYKNGPLISPAHFREFFLPEYKKFIEFVKTNVDIVLVDTDGNFYDLIPSFLEVGVDGFLPIEVAAGMDPVKIRERYGKSFCMIGGVDKREIAQDYTSIENELKKLSSIIATSGGYIPHIDHGIPPDVSLNNFQYYLEFKKKIIG